jgi:hypothetical protein
VGEAAVAAVWASVEEAKTAPVTVVEEAEPWSGARRHGAEEALVYRHHWWRSRRR